MISSGGTNESKESGNNKGEIGLRGSHSVIVGRGIVKAEGKMGIVNKRKEKE